MDRHASHPSSTQDIPWCGYCKDAPHHPKRKCEAYGFTCNCGITAHYTRLCSRVSAPTECPSQGPGVLPSIPRRGANPPRAPGSLARTEQLQLAVAHIRAHNALNLLDLNLMKLKMENQIRDSNPSSKASTLEHQVRDGDPGSKPFTTGAISPGWRPRQPSLQYGAKSGRATPAAKPPRRSTKYGMETPAAKPP
jgi:hypothetical protein